MMRSIEKLNQLLSLTRNKNLLPTITQNYSQCYCNSTQTYNKGISYTITLKNSSEFLQKNSFNNVIIRTIFLSGIYCKVKSSSKKQPKSIKDLDLRETSEVVDVDKLMEQMNQAIENMKTEFIKNLTVRSATGQLEQIPVKIDGKEYQIQEIAQISRKPKLLVLDVANFPTAIPEILRAIQQSGVNINPQQDGTTIFLPIPKVTKEHRESLCKNAKSIFIRHRDQIKDIKMKAVKSIKKKEHVSKDLVHRVEAQLNVICDKYLKDAELILESKQNQLIGSSD